MKKIMILAEVCDVLPEEAKHLCQPATCLAAMESAIRIDSQENTAANRYQHLFEQMKSCANTKMSQLLGY